MKLLGYIAQVCDVFNVWVTPISQGQIHGGIPIPDVPRDPEAAPSAISRAAPGHLWGATEFVHGHAEDIGVLRISMH